MTKSLKEIAQVVGGELVGDGDIVVCGARGIKDATKDDITFLANGRYEALLGQTKAAAIIVSIGQELSSHQSKPTIKVEDASLAFAQIVSLFNPVKKAHPKGIHPTAVIAQSAKIGQDVGIGAYVIIEEEVEVGDRTVIYGSSYVGRNVRIGCDCLLYANSSLRENTLIGNRVSIQSGSVIGSEGFGYAKIKGEYKLIPQIGCVVIEDDVDIGANVTIDRARFDKTLIGRGTKIDNLVHIAHNVVIGENCVILAQVGISGSTRIGDRATLAGQAGLVGHIEVGHDAICAAQAGVTKSVPPKTIVSGYPAKPHAQAKKVNAYVQRLPELFKSLKELKNKIENIKR